MATSPKKKFPGRQEELPAVAEFIYASFNRDLALFTDYSKDFDAAYAANFRKQIDDLTEVVFPKTLTQQGKLVTARIVTNLARLKILNDLTDSYVKRAGSALTVSPADFGCRDVRKKIKSGDVEGVVKALRIVLQNVDANLATLTAKGLKDATKTEMAALPDTLTADNTLQNTNAQARNQLVNDNIGLFDSLYAIMRDVAEVGKVIHKTTSGTPERAADYVMAGLLKKVRNEGKKGEEETK
ncbi:MAG: hypothetical protein MUC59_14585 [Saprospiraceae bacterium]|jgi:hypothetical protein|nr:hypothetical protein [Saprospiraceae bacterium]